MNDAEYEAQRERLHVLSERWVRAIGLGWWKVTLSYDRTGEDFADSTKSSGGWRSTAAARCFADWRYAEATIIWNMPELEHVDDEALEGVFVHELMHVFLNELRPVSEVDDEQHVPHEERVCTTLTKAFMWIRDAAANGEMGGRDNADGSPAAIAAHTESA